MELQLYAAFCGQFSDIVTSISGMVNYGQSRAALMHRPRLSS
jgi:hypothetical protein